MSTRRCASGLVLLLALILAACGSNAAPLTQAPAPVPTTGSTTAPTATISTATSPGMAAPTVATAAGVTITDVAGRTVTVAAPPQRIISLAPSDTEILFALDLGPKVIAVDDFSDYPADAKDLPKIGGTNATYNFEQIVALKPDLILATSITPPEAIKKLEELKQTVIVLGTAQTTFESISADIALIGMVTGQADKARQVTDAMQQRLDAIKAKVATVKIRPRVYWELDATDPAKPYSVGSGNFVNDLIVLAGGTNIFEQASLPFLQVSSEQVVVADPEIIILSDAAYGITVESVAQRPGWQVITAVKQQRIEPIDDNLVSRPGPRIVDGLEATAMIIHPEIFK